MPIVIVVFLVLSLGWCDMHVATASWRPPRPTETTSSLPRDPRG